MSFFGKKKQKASNVGKIRKYDEEKVSFEEKTFSSFKIASLPYWDGVKCAGGSRASCIKIHVAEKFHKRKKRIQSLSDLNIG